jgi:hypothetical protein
MAQAPAPRPGVQRRACAGLSQEEASVARCRAGGGAPEAPPASASQTRVEDCHTMAARACSTPLLLLALQLLALSRGTPGAALGGRPLNTPTLAKPQAARGREVMPGGAAAPTPSPAAAACRV